MSIKCVSRMLSVIIALLPLNVARASDAEFSRALTAAGCLPNRVAVVRKEQALQIYEVSCLGEPPRSVGVTCLKQTCSVSSGGNGGSAGNAGK